MNWTDGVVETWTDEQGDWRLGWENGITAPEVCERIGANPEDRRDVQLAQISINQVIRRYVEPNGLIAYGTGRKPRLYVIAKNELEEQALGYEVMRYNMGRITRMARVTRSLPKVSKKVGTLKNEVVRQLELFDSAQAMQ